jgi:DNA/RNA endonuclease YhcR with UshA esterase domain
VSHCSQCGRYVGPYEACPYCGSRMAGRIPVRVVKVAAVGLATVGLFLLWQAATRSAVPRVQIGRAGATMNFAYARVEGWVVRGPDFYADSGYLAFTVADDSGEIRVSAYRGETDAMLARGQVPALGDRVSVAGTLRVREGGVALTINVPDHVEVLRPEAVGREIGSITPSDHLLRVRVQGQVWEVRQPYEGLTLVTLRDPTGAIDVVVDRSLEALTGAFLPPEPGQSLEVVGAVDLYRDTPQIVPTSARDVFLLPELVPVASRSSIGDLGAGDVSRFVAVQGTVTELASSSTWVKFTLDDGTGEVAVFLWQDVAQALPNPEALVVGARLQVVGEVSLYRGELEVVPERAQDLMVMAGSE